MYRPKHFILQELVCPEVFQKYGDTAWEFFDEKLLITIDFLRDQLGPVYINGWDSGKEFTQRGFRCIQCQLVKDAIKRKELYVSPHMTGQAIDCDIQGMTAGQVRVWIIENQYILPYAVRIENDVPWLHIDTRDTGIKVYRFNN